MILPLSPHGVRGSLRRHARLGISSLCLALVTPKHTGGILEMDFDATGLASLLKGAQLSENMVLMLKKLYVLCRYVL